MDSTEIQAFFRCARQQLSLSDVETIRIIEGLVDVLIAKKLLLTELPLPARQKLMERQPSQRARRAR
jgi:hypothetical protein